MPLFYILHNYIIQNERYREIPEIILIDLVA